MPPQPIAVLVPALLIPRAAPSRHGGRDGARHRTGRHSYRTGQHSYRTGRHRYRTATAPPPHCLGRCSL